MSMPPKVTRIGPIAAESAGLRPQRAPGEGDAWRAKSDLSEPEHSRNMRETLAPKAARTTVFVIGGVLAAVFALTLIAMLVNSIMDYKLGGAEQTAAPAPPVSSGAPTAQDMEAAQKKLGDALLKLNMQPAGSAPANETLQTPRGREDGADAPPAPQPLAAPPAPTVSADEVSRTLARASSFIREGQVASARALLERVLGSNDPSVAFALAETFDPKTLARWRAIGIAGDPARARELYKAALDGGIAEAKDRLGGLDR